MFGKDNSKLIQLRHVFFKKQTDMNSKGTTIAIIAASVLLSSSIFFVGIQVKDMTAAIFGTPGERAAAPAPAPEAKPADNDSGPVDVELRADDHIKGDKNAPVVIVEYSDFECPFCGRFYSDTLGQVEDTYIKTGKAKLAYRHFPLSFHQNAMPAAIASECAGDQGKFWEMHNAIFDNQTAIGPDNLKKHAAQIGLDTAKFNKCFDGREHESEIRTEMAEGSQFGVSGTPGFFINGKSVSGAQPFEVFKSIIESEL